MIDLDQLVRDANSLDPLPQSAARLARVLSGDDWSVEDVTGAIAHDPALTARVLRAANSAIYASGGRGSASLDQAVMRMGSGMIVTLVITPAMRGVMRAVPAGALSRPIWEHSIAASLAADLMRLVTREPIPAEATSAALLHDLGRVVLARRIDARSARQIEEAQRGGVDPRVAEREVLGVDHAEVGAVIAQRWSLPHDLVDAIRTHHDPSEAGGASRRLADVIAIADWTARTGGHEGGEGAPPELAPESLDRLGLDKKALGELGELVGERFREVLALYE